MHQKTIVLADGEVFTMLSSMLSSMPHHIRCQTANTDPSGNCVRPQFDASFLWFHRKPCLMRFNHPIDGDTDAVAAAGMKNHEH